MSSVMSNRRAAKVGEAGTVKKHDSYTGAQCKFLKWLAATGGWLRGVKLKEKTPKPFPMVTREFVILFMFEVYAKGWQFRTRTKDPPGSTEDPLWWKKYFFEWYNKTLPDDTERTYRNKKKSNDMQRKPLTWHGSAEGMLKALNDLQTQIMSTDPDSFNKYCR